MLRHAVDDWVETIGENTSDLIEKILHGTVVVAVLLVIGLVIVASLIYR